MCLEEEAYRVEEKRPRFVDIHTHILPGVDDGAEDMEQAIGLLQAAWEDGTGAVVLTPHYRGRYRHNTVNRLTPVFEALQREVKKLLPGMELYLGNEVGYELDVTEKLADGTLLTLNGSQYVLLEFRGNCFRSRVLDGVLEVLNFGFVPVIAHVERYDIFLKSKSLADEVLDLGALLQVNADSVMGKRGFAAKRFCHRLLKGHKVHFVATDTHDSQLRPPLLKECYDRIQKKYGAEYAAALFYKNAREVLTGGVEIEC